MSVVFMVVVVVMMMVVVMVMVMVVAVMKVMTVMIVLHRVNSKRGNRQNQKSLISVATSRG